MTAIHRCVPARAIAIVLLMTALPVLAPAVGRATVVPRVVTASAAVHVLQGDLAAHGLPAVQRGALAGARKQGGAIASLVRRGRLCVARPRLAALLRALGSRRLKLSGTMRAQLSAAVLTVDTAILSSGRARRCGGSKATPHATPSTRVLRSTPTGVELQVTLPAARLIPRVEGGRPYVALEMPGLGSAGKAGEPSVPGLHELLALPNGARVALKLSGSASYVVGGVALAPNQPEPVDAAVTPPGKQFADKPFTIDRRTYGSDKAFPPAAATGATLGMMRDVGAGDVGLLGAQYRPHSKRLRIFTSLTVTVDFKGGNGTFGDARMTSAWNAPALQLYRNLFVNVSTAVAHAGSEAHFALCGEEILIVTSHALRPAADTLAAARQHDGFRTRVVETGSGAGQAGTTADEIAAYVQREVASPTCLVRPSYLILLGDTSQVPTFPSDDTTSGDIPSDLDYSLRFHGLYLPDLAVGRISAGDVATANTVVSKIVGYEDAPPGGTAFYRNATVTSYFQTTHDSDTQDERGFTRTAEAVRDGLIANGKTVSRVYTTAATNPLTYDTGDPIPSALRKPGFAWNGTGADVISQINDGRFLVVHRDHGYETGVTNPNLTTGDVASMTNGGKLPVVFLIDCSAGTFDDPGTPSLAEALQRRAGGGAVSVIAASRESPSETNNVFTLGLVDAIWPSVLPYDGSSTPTLRMGDVLNLGKLHVLLQGAQLGADSARQESRLYQLFGDPSMEIRRSAPAFVGLAQTSLAAGVVNISVSGAGSDGALATLLQDGVPIGKALLDGRGAATLRPDAPIGDGTKLDVVIDQGGFEKKTIALRAATPPNPPPPPSNLPDLQYGALQTQPQLGFMTIAIKNAGGVDSGPFSVDVSAQSGQFTGVPTLETRTFEFSHGVPAGQAVAGDFGVIMISSALCPITVKIDPAGAVQESDRSNNTVELSDPGLCSPPAP